MKLLHTIAFSRHRTWREEEALSSLQPLSQVQSREPALQHDSRAQIGPTGHLDPNPGSSNSQLNIGFNFPPPSYDQPLRPQGRPPSESQAEERGVPHTQPFQQSFNNFFSFTQVKQSVESRGESEAGASTSGYLVFRIKSIMHT